MRESDTLGFARPLNWGIFNRLRKGRFDVVWVLGYAQLFALNAIVAARTLGIPVLLRSDSNLCDRVRSAPTLAAKRVLAGLLRLATSGVLAVGRANERYWRHYFGPDVPIVTMRYAVDNDFFRRKALEAAPHRERFRSELGLDPGRPVILFASKLLTRKRCIDLVDAYTRLAPSCETDPSAYLLIVGDGEERSHLEARARESGLSGIRFIGFRNQTELPQFYDLCDVFVLPSIHEPWGLIVNEVMNVGRPVVVTDQVGCQPDLVHDGFNGFVYPALDVDALTECLRRLVDDPALRATMGENSLRIIQQYSFEEDVAGLRRALALVVSGFAA
jgi:glycosyltransferase involved in cell wall biosynthesis